jgi:mono/diheme cytochrome c family protein
MSLRALLPSLSLALALSAAVAMPIALAGCSPRARYARGGELVAPLEVVDVDWNPARAPFGHAAAVADDGDAVVVFGDAGAVVLAAGVPVATDGRITRWRDAATIAAADGDGSWIVGLDGDGRVHRVRARSRLEPIGDRYALQADAVRAVAWAGERRVAFALGAPGSAGNAPSPTVALADGAQVAFFDYGPVRAMAAGGGKLALLPPPPTDGAAVILRLVDLEHGADVRYALPGAERVAVDAHGHVFAASRTALWSDDGLGRLRLRYVARAGEIGALVASGDVAWFREGRELGRLAPRSASDDASLDGTDRVEVTASAPVSIDARLFPSAGGDVWVVDAGTVRRLAPRTSSPSTRASASQPSGSSASSTSSASSASSPSSPLAAPPTSASPPDARAREAWEQEIRPIFVRRCSACHLPRGGAGVDLSSYDAWSLRRTKLRERVVDKREMPPYGAPMSDDERTAIAGWIARP